LSNVLDRCTEGHPYPSKSWVIRENKSAIGPKEAQTSKTHRLPAAGDEKEVCRPGSQRNTTTKHSRRDQGCRLVGTEKRMIQDGSRGRVATASQNRCKQNNNFQKTDHCEGSGDSSKKEEVSEGELGHSRDSTNQPKGKPVLENARHRRTAKLQSGRYARGG